MTQVRVRFGGVSGERGSTQLAFKYRGFSSVDLLGAQGPSKPRKINAPFSIAPNPLIKATLGVIQLPVVILFVRRGWQTNAPTRKYHCPEFCQSKGVESSDLRA